MQSSNSIAFRVFTQMKSDTSLDIYPRAATITAFSVHPEGSYYEDYGYFKNFKNTFLKYSWIS